MSKNGFLERSKGNTLDFNDYTISGVWVFSDTGFINGPFSPMNTYKNRISIIATDLQYIPISCFKN